MSAAAEHARSLLLTARAGEAPEADRLASELTAVDASSIPGDEARIAFWLNLYNALVLTELAREPRSGSLLRHRAMFRSAFYRVGEHDYSLDVIEHGVLRRNARVPLRVARTLRRGDPRLAAMPRRLDPRIHFALNCGAVSCPPIRDYRAEALDAELERITVAYLSAETRIDRERRRIELPYLIRLYRADFGDRAARLAFAARHLAEHDAAWLRSQGRIRVDYGRFDWTLTPAAE